MALVVRLQITSGSHHRLDDIETLEVRRLTMLRRDREHADDEVHEYVAHRLSPTGEIRARAQFEHRYGDGAWRCVQRALHAMGGHPAEIAEPELEPPC